MLVPKVPAKEFVKYGFKKCKGFKGYDGYYLCVARGCKVIFITDVFLNVANWQDDDKRIHKHPNCRYRDMRSYLDIIYELIKADMLKSEWEK